MSSPAKEGKRTPVADAALRIQPDSRLVTLARQGYDRAFDEIVRRYRTRLVAFAGGVVPAHRAEDVVQDGLARAWLALTESESEIELRPWLYRIIRNGALNSRRDERAHERIDDDFDGVPQPPDVAERREDLKNLVAALQALPAAQRKAIVRREMEGQGHEEIAAELDTTPGGVRQLIYRARTALRDGVGFLVPLPVMRHLLELSGAEAAAGAGAAAGGVGLAMKAGTVVAVTAVAVGSGVAIKHRADRGTNEGQAVAREQNAGRGNDAPAGSAPSPASDPSSSSAVSSADAEGSSDEGPSEDRSGPGSNGTSGPGNSSGPGSDGDSSGSGEGATSSSGSGDDDPADSEVDNSGSGSSGSGSSGSGSSGSGSSGSDSGGSGSGGSDSFDAPEIEEPEVEEPAAPEEDNSGSGSSGSGSNGSGSSGSG